VLDLFDKVSCYMVVTGMDECEELNAFIVKYYLNVI